MSSVVNKTNIWIQASRPKTLPAAIAPVLLGVALAVHDGHLRWFVGIMTLAAALLIQIGTNLANDLFDFLKGTDTEERIGPTRVTQAGLLSTTEVRNGTIFTFGFAVVIGFYLAWVGGWPIVWIGLASIIAGIAYTGGPYPLGYHGWADIFVILFFGLIAVPGTYYLQTNAVSTEAFLIGFAMGAMSTAILVVNNLRDINTDAKAGKKSLAVRFGKRFTRWEYTLMMISAYIIPVIISVLWKHDLALYLVLFSLPVAVRAVLFIWTLEEAALNPMLGRTSHLMMLYSILLTLGLIL